jgi:hypothetical protein
MKHVKLFESFLRSYYNTVNEQEKSSTQLNTGYAVTMAFTDTDNIKSDVAAKMGVQKDTKYTFETDDFISFLHQCQKNGKFNLDVLGKGEKVPAGKDILEIGDKKIDEKGFIVLQKEDFEGDKIKITASNNGLLCLMRMAVARNKIMEKGKIIMTGGSLVDKEYAVAESWSMKFELGVPVGKAGESEDRGYKMLWMTTTDVLGLIGAALSKLSLGVLKNQGLDDLMAVKSDDYDRKGEYYRKQFDAQTDEDYQLIKDANSMAEVVEKIAISMSKSLKNLNIFCNPNTKPDTNLANSLADKGKKSEYLENTKDLSTIQRKDASSAKEVAFNNKLYVVAPKDKLKTDAEKVYMSIVDSVLPPSDTFKNLGSGLDVIVDKYRENLKKILTSPYDTNSLKPKTIKNEIGAWLKSSQQINNWKNVSWSQGSTGDDKVKQGSGKY